MNAIVVKNIAANLLARVWVAGLQLICAPLYLSFLGPTSYGLVGFYTSLLLTLLFLDQAVSPVLIRELARPNRGAEGAREARNTLRTLELLSGSTAVVLGLVLWSFSPYIASHWIHDDTFPVERLTTIVRLMGLTIACQWPAFLFNAGFVGLQRQDAAMRLRIVLATVQWGGAALLLWLVRPEVEVFFYWQVISLALTTFVLRLGLWKIMPRSAHVALFDLAKLRPIWLFAAGSLAVGITGSLLTQADKLLVAKYASLDQLAGYSLCFLISSLLSAFISQPINAGLLPHFSGLMATGREKRLAFEYHGWTQWVAVVAFPITAALIVFPQALVQIWLPRESFVGGTVIALVPWIAAGTLFNVVSTLPYVLQMAAGTTRLLLLKNILALAVVLPALVYGLPKYGPIVGAWCWLAVNLGYYLFEVPIMHLRLLKGELWAWWLRDTLFPGVFVGFVFVAASHLFPNTSGWKLLLLTVSTTLTAMILLSVLLPGPRAKLTALRFNKKSVL